MYIINGIAYAGELSPGIEVAHIAALNDFMLLITFNTGEKRLYDAVQLLNYPAFKPLGDEGVFKAVKVEHGVATWLEGAIDIAPETLYTDSVPYEDAVS